MTPITPFDARRARLGTLGIRHNLGVGLALALRDESQILALAWLAPDGHEASALIAERKLQVVCFRRHRVEHQSVLAFDEVGVLEDLRREANDSGVMPTLAYWRALGPANSVEHLLTPNDRAARASARIWDDRIERLREELPSLVAQAKEARPTQFTPPYALFWLGLYGPSECPMSRTWVEEALRELARWDARSAGRDGGRRVS